MMTCFLPLCALADHEEILIPIFAQIASIGILIFSLFALKATTRNKIVLSIIYLLSLILIIYFTSDIPYMQNRSFIDISLAAGPAIITVIFYFILKFTVNKSKWLL
jgi:hypothetical protein